MRKFFENPEMVINVFDTDIHTEALASAAALNAAQTAATNGVAKLDGITYDTSGQAQMSNAAVQIFEFK